MLERMPGSWLRLGWVGVGVVEVVEVVEGEEEEGGRGVVGREERERMGTGWRLGRSRAARRGRRGEERVPVIRMSFAVAGGLRVEVVVVVVDVVCSSSFASWCG